MRFSSRPRRFIAALSVVAIGSMATACGQQGSTPSAASAAASMAESAAESAEPAVTATTEPATDAPDGAVVIEVGPGPNFIPEELSVPPGTVTFFLDGSAIDEGITHNINIGLELPPEAPLVVSDFLTAGESAIFTVSGLEPGSYVFWCSVDEHHAIGMVGTLEVV